MAGSLDPDHQKQRLVFFVAQDVDADIRASVRAFVQRLAPLRNWLNGPPRFVNSREQPADPSRGDLPVETVGDLQGLMDATRIGQDVAVAVVRHGQLTTVSVRPAELPA